MEIILYVSITLLILMLGFRGFELTRGRGRVLELLRVRLDRITIKVGKKLRSIAKRSIEYAHKDILLNGLHMVIYVALLFVRYLERKLEKVTYFLRSFRKRKGAKDSTDQS